MFAQISLSHIPTAKITAKNVDTRSEGGTLNYIRLEFQHAATKTQVSWVDVNLNDKQAEDLYHQIGHALSERSLRQLTAHYPDAGTVATTALAPAKDATV